MRSFDRKEHNEFHTHESRQITEPKGSGRVALRRIMLKLELLEAFTTVTVDHDEPEGMLSVAAAFDHLAGRRPGDRRRQRHLLRRTRPPRRAPLPGTRIVTGCVGRELRGHVRPDALSRPACRVPPAERPRFPEVVDSVVSLIILAGFSIHFRSRINHRQELISQSNYFFAPPHSLCPSRWSSSSPR